MAQGMEADRTAREFARIVLAAGAPVMQIYAGDAQARLKPDQSPVTAADERAEQVILEELGKSFPGVQVVAEESCSAHGLPRDIAEETIFVDPLDGTREFLSRNGEFTINIGLVRAGVPVAGAVFAPALGRLWWSGTQAHGLHIQAGMEMPDASAAAPLRTRRPASPLDVLESRSHVTPGTKAALSRLSPALCRPVGSSLKFCLIAGGEADVCLRLGPTMEWDTAAGDAVLRAAGGLTLGPDGRPLIYGKASEGFRNPSFVAWGDADLARAHADLAAL